MENTGASSFACLCIDAWVEAFELIKLEVADAASAITRELITFETPMAKTTKAIKDEKPNGERQPVKGTEKIKLTIW